MRRLRRLVRREHLLPAVLGVVDGILTALTLAAGRLAVAQAEPMELGLALRIAVGAVVTGGFVYFVAHYAALREELIHAERQLNLTARGRLATTRLGRAVVREALMAEAVAGACSFAGALLPLLVGVVWPALPWLSIGSAILALGLLGVCIARTVVGSPVRWVLVLVLAGVIVAIVGVNLRLI